MTISCQIALGRYPQEDTVKIENGSFSDIPSPRFGTKSTGKALKAYTNRVFSGTIAAISPNGIFNGTSSTYPVIITINQDSTDGITLLPNMSASITITMP